MYNLFNLCGNRYALTCKKFIIIKIDLTKYYKCLSTVHVIRRKTVLKRIDSTGFL